MDRLRSSDKDMDLDDPIHLFTNMRSSSFSDLAAAPQQLTHHPKQPFTGGSHNFNGYHPSAENLSPPRAAATDRAVSLSSPSCGVDSPSHPPPTHLHSKETTAEHDQSRCSSVSAASSPSESPGDSIKLQPTARQPTTLAAAADRNVAPPQEGSSAGPATKIFQIPPRQKPGRKAATDQPDTKRKQQNRDAQRAFRARKNEKTSELQGQVDEKDKQLRLAFDEIKSLKQDNAQCQEHIRGKDEQIFQFQRSYTSATQRIAELESQNKRIPELQSRIHEHLATINELQIQLSSLQATQLSEPLRDALAMSHGGLASGQNMDIGTSAMSIDPIMATTDGIFPTSLAPVSLPMSSQGQDFLATSMAQPHSILFSSAGASSIAPMENSCISCPSNGDCACLNISADSGMTVQQGYSGHSTGAGQTIQANGSAIRHENYMLLETDFTNSGNHAQTTPVGYVSEKNSAVGSEDGEYSTPPSTAIATSYDPDPCGFCTNPSNCLCRPEEAPSTRPSRKSRATTEAVDKSMPPPRVKPGTCAQCMADPEQRRFCEGLARSRPPETSPLGGNEQSSKRRRLSLAQPKGDIVSCNEAYAIFTAQHKPNPSSSAERDLESFYQDCVRTTAPPSREHRSNPDKPSQRYSAYDVELAGCLLQLRRSSNSDHGAN